MRLRAVLVLLVALVLAGCGGGDGDGIEARRESRTLRIGEFPWSAATATNALLAAVIARHPELGIERVERVAVSPEEGWRQLEDGDLDLLTEVYLPNQSDFAARAAEEADLVHRVYAGAANAWYVPAYTVAPGGAARGLESVDQLRRYAGAFDGELYDGESGWVTTRQNADRIKGFRLPLRQVTGNEHELVDELVNRYARRRPILLYLWRPHWAHSAFDLVELEEPNPYSSACFTGERLACAMPTNDVWVAGRRDLRERAPHVWELLNRFELPLATLERLLLEIERRGQPADQVARRWIERNADDVGVWLGRAPA